MAQYVIEILDGDRAGEVVSVDARSIRIGRKPGNDLVLPDEKASGVHAEVAWEGERHVLRDLGSTNGTFMDNKKVTEVVLAPGDAFLIGRTRMRYRDETAAGTAGAAPATAGGDAVDVIRFDAARLQKAGRSRSVGLLLVLLVVAGGTAGFLVWKRGRTETADPEQQVASGPKKPIEVAGNQLAAALAACDGDEGWNLGFAGSGFVVDTGGHTGNGCLQAQRGGSADFAVATLKEPFLVLAGRTLTAHAYLRTEGGGVGGIRLHFHGSADSQPFHFRSGTVLAAHAGWEQVTCSATVPEGCDRGNLELVAVLPAEGARLAADDVAVVEGGTAVAQQSTVQDSNQTLLLSGGAVAVRSTDQDQPATLLRVAPDPGPGAFQALHRAGLLVPSDLGASIQVDQTERSLHFTLRGEAPLPAGAALAGAELAFPADAAGSLLVRGGSGGFHSQVAAGSFAAQQLLLGDRATRCLVQLPAEQTCVGRVQGGEYRLQIGGLQCELVLGFRDLRQQAGGHLREAGKLAAAGKPGAALDELRVLLAETPHDSEKLGQAQAMRTELLAGLADRTKRLQDDLAEASFFETRGGFERVLAGLDELQAVYGEDNFEEPKAMKAMREKASTALQGLDGQRLQDLRTRLLDMAAAFEKTSQKDLAAVVRDYVERELKGK